MFDIRVGTILTSRNALEMAEKLKPYGFESYQITLGASAEGIDVPEMAKRVKGILEGTDTVISALGVYGNPLTGEGPFADTLHTLEQAIDHARDFGCDIVGAFTGALPGQPMDQSIPRFKQVFGELGKRAADRGVRIAFENCPMGGTWRSGDQNIAVNPDAWDLMFDALPLDNLGLEWEPAHQLMELADPIAQLRKWAGKVFHIHGKDATIAWDVLREHGLNSPARFRWNRTPGFGDTNWNDVVTILRQHGYQGTIDIEGYHDPVYSNEKLEWTSQVRALRYLKDCRGGQEMLPF